MTKDTRSFFERLTGAEHVDDDYQDDPEEFGAPHDSEMNSWDESGSSDYEQPAGDGELAIDMYETKNDLFIKTVVAGVRPDELDISITREQVSIHGSRTPERGFDGQQYYFQEIYWGPFSRTVDLPQEIEVDEAEAVAKHGLLIIRLPKINKDRETKLKVKTS